MKFPWPGTAGDFIAREESAEELVGRFGVDPSGVWYFVPAPEVCLSREDLVRILKQMAQLKKPST